MNTKISVFVIYVEANIYNLYDCTFNTNVMLVTPGRKKSPNFLSNFKFATNNLKSMVKYSWLMLDNFNLSNCLSQ